MSTFRFLSWHNILFAQNRKLPHSERLLGKVRKVCSQYFLFAKSIQNRNLFSKAQKELLSCPKSKIVFMNHFLTHRRNSISIKWNIFQNKRKKSQDLVYIEHIHLRLMFKYSVRWIASSSLNIIQIIMKLRITPIEWVNVLRGHKEALTFDQYFQTILLFLRLWKTASL